MKSPTVIRRARGVRKTFRTTVSVRRTLRSTQRPRTGRRRSDIRRDAIGGEGTEQEYCRRRKRFGSATISVRRRSVSVFFERNSTATLHPARGRGNPKRLINNVPSSAHKKTSIPKRLDGVNCPRYLVPLIRRGPVFVVVVVSEKRPFSGSPFEPSPPKFTFFEVVVGGSKVFFATYGGRLDLRTNDTSGTIVVMNRA